ncbi:nucleolar DEAD-box protein required for synthesis of 60S ribosomal subunit [Alternaria metachromatica]|uniref:nucleolar DEAD-box protein required for synthesis of 60S ribosomal subunit n=1 Tax=Alternaria metachromatica TaxID=283354 RepID=UPI0020C3BF93|nr:nucleolar DEAD-box protein required for synthesis of 60S ribosomal subunit [Alternaria metachromatica]KAI4623284.1 nucleolar DEAD-box protein required for synthesis of 60S ribosomal subunit [Alternaria metachromatica]
MAPKDDDFIFTISDHDDVSDDGGADEAAATAKLAGAGKKRKYTEDPDLNVKPKEVASKKAKKDKKKGKKGADPAPEIEDDNAMPEPTEDVEQNDDIASDFEFAVGDIDTGFVEEFDGWGNDNGTVAQESQKKGTAVDVDDIIERRRNKKSAQAVIETESPEASVNGDFEGFGEDDELMAEDGFGMGAASDSEEDQEDEEEASGAEGSGSEEEGDSDEEAEVPHVPHPMDLEGAETDQEDQSEEEDAVEAKKAAAFFAPEDSVQIKKKKGAKGGTGSFQAMSLSRPILRGLASVGFTEPTPIQNKAVPIAMQGKDVVGGAETGSGKTAAFLIPILERLLYRPKKVPTTRVAIFMPTRELAVQCFNVATKLASFTDITFALMAGGFSTRDQEAVLKTRPDVVIATPGRFIDHMHNTAAFQVEHLEILVLDEADRMLEEGFESQLNEILTTIPKSRQTMLFSATMTSSVDKLIRIGMDKPVRLMVDAKKHTVAGLTQEFVRLRQGKEDKRLAYLMYICEKIYTEKVIIFFRQKKEAHRVRVVFALCGLKASELHGNMSQEQRIQSVEAFRSGKSAYLLATDVASRGLDIKNVAVVINYEAPQSHDIYMHRVGRTARAGRSGRACTLAAEPDRKVVKQAVKASRDQGAKVVSRQVPVEETDRWMKKIKDLEGEIEEVLAEEKEERAMSVTERDLKRGENLIQHEDEIKSRPRRTWFESEKDKLAEKEKGAAALNGSSQSAGAAMKAKKGKKLSGKDRKKLEMNDVRSEGKVWKKGKADRGLSTGKAKEKQAHQKAKSKKIAAKTGSFKGFKE